MYLLMSYKNCGSEDKHVWARKAFFKLGFTLCKTEEPLQGMELQEKEEDKD